MSSDNAHFAERDPVLEAAEARRRRRADFLSGRRDGAMRAGKVIKDENEQTVVRPFRYRAFEAGELSTRFLKTRELKAPDKHQRLREAWVQIVGDELAGKTHVVRYRGGIVTVDVKGSPLLQELEQFYKNELLESLRGAVTNVLVRDIRFRLEAR